MRRSAGARLARALATAAALAVALPAPAARETPPAAPRMDYVPPAPGTYVLQRIQRAPSGFVLESDGTARAFSEYTTGRITLLALMYTYCTDRYGCPLAYDTFVEVRARLLKRPGIAARVRLVSLSFDPTNDTPAAMRLYGGKFVKPEGGLAWHFLTTSSVKALLPLLDGLGQDASIEVDARGRPTRTINHNLKVFLIDRTGVVREIYSPAFLFPDVVMNDIETLALEEKAGR
ncbi:MAG: SCO family protein [Burkholderiales bacterium]|nr:SCO family protein [Burkholderiales bacterium]